MDYSLSKEYPLFLLIITQETVSNKCTKAFNKNEYCDIDAVAHQ